MEYQGGSVVEWRRNITSDRGRCRLHLGLLLSVFTVNAILPNLLMSYGTLLASAAHNDVPPWVAFFCPAAYIVVFYLAQPWCRELSDSWGEVASLRWLALLGTSITATGVLISAFVPFSYHALTYGVFAGFGGSLVSAQIDAILYDTYDSRLNQVRALCCSGQALGQFVMPHILLILVDAYGIYMCHVVISAIIIQVIPIILLMKSHDNLHDRNRPVSRYSDLSRTYTTFNSSKVAMNYQNDLQLIELNKKSWKNPSDNTSNQFDEDNPYIYENSDTTTPPSSPSADERKKNIFGVEILPEIPEESEFGYSTDGDDDTSQDLKAKRLSRAIKRLSIMSDNFDESIARVNRRESNVTIDEENEYSKYTEIDITFSTVLPNTDVAQEINKRYLYNQPRRYCWPRNCCSFSSYRWYRIKRRCLFAMYSFNDTLIKPLSRSLSYWRFYPALLLRFSFAINKLLMSSMIPLLSYNLFPCTPLKEANFLISLHAFSWLCFLLTTPWLINVPKTQYRYLTVCAYFITSAGAYLISDSSSQIQVTLGCITAGFGYGAIVSTSEDTLRDWLGLRKWPKVQGTLECLTAILTGIFAIGIVILLQQNCGILTIFFVLTIFQLVAGLVWFIVIAVKFIISRRTQNQEMVANLS